MSLQDRLDRHTNAIDAINAPPRPGTSFPYPYEWTNWRDEQRAWTSTAILFNQSWHMHDLFISGPDTLKLLSDTSVNSYTGFGPNRAKQYLALAPDGNVIGDEILFGLEDDLVALVGQAPAINWITYQAEVGGYDVELVRDHAGWGRLGPVPKRFYRYEVEGPLAWKIIEQAAGTKLDPIGFFRMGDIEIAGKRVRVLNHTMGGVPGEDSTGLELFGPEEDHEAFLEAILAAGADHGLVRGGSLAYGSTILESGWIGNVVPAIYTDPALRAYREQLPDTAHENANGLYGSYRPESIEGFYMRPWDLGYGRMVKLDHDFIGREALEAVPLEGRRRKVWLTWDTADVERLLLDAHLDRAPRPRTPFEPYIVVRDAVLVGDETVGMTQMSGFTDHLGGWTSVATVDERLADGTQVEILWGDFDGGASNPYTPTHEPRRIRATLSSTSPVA